MKRRALLHGSVPLLLVGGLASYALTPKAGVVSYSEAQAVTDALVDRQIALSQKFFGVTYSPEHVKQIHTRLWDSAHLMLSEAYDFKENRSDLSAPIADAPTGARRTIGTGSAPPAAATIGR